MKSLRPFTILALGSGVPGIVIARTFDAITPLAMGVLFVGAWIKTLLGTVYDPGGRS